MATYTFGSEARAHERSLLACPTLRWLGIHAADISHFRVPTSLKIDMTERDRSRVRKMLERESFSAKPERTFWRQQMQMFLDLNWYLDVVFPLDDDVLSSCLILQIFTCTFVPHPMTIRIPYTVSYGSSKYEIEALNAVHRDGCDPLGFLSGTFIHDKIHRRDYWQDPSL